MNTNRTSVWLVGVAALVVVTTLTLGTFLILGNQPGDTPTLIRTSVMVLAELLCLVVGCWLCLQFAKNEPIAQALAYGAGANGLFFTVTLALMFLYSAIRNDWGYLNGANDPSIYFAIAILFIIGALFGLGITGAARGLGQWAGAAIGFVEFVLTGLVVWFLWRG